MTEYGSSPDMAALAAVSAMQSMVSLFVAVLVIVGMWKMFEKAGQPGWAAIVPIYNAYVLLKVAGRPGWWLLLMLVPFVNIVIAFLVSLDIARVFGKDTVWGILLFLFSPIMYLVLGFSDATYQGNAAPSVA